MTKLVLFVGTILVFNLIVVYDIITQSAPISSESHVDSLLFFEVDSDETDKAPVNNNLFTDAINQFAVKLYGKSTNNTKNYFISPYSIWMALALTYVGANGETRNELRELLNITPDQDEDLYKQVERFHKQIAQSNGNYSLEMANRIFAQEGFQINRQYIESIQKYFGADVISENFNDAVASANDINKWVSEKTNNKINNLVDPSSIDKLTRMIVVNAIYFKGLWLNRFDKANTTKYEFKSLSGEKKDIEMMRAFGKEFKCLIDPIGLRASVCELPYVGEKITMSLVLPNEGVSLSEFENSLDKDKLRSILDEKPISKVNLYLPKFKLEYKQAMNEDLISLGAKTAFSSEADFSGISPDDLFISDVVHQAMLEVNEEGTEAAAATEVILDLKSLVVEEVVDFICDRPFMIIIHDNVDKCVLFVGKYLNPV